jgi:uncharacterized protein YqgV (UPF0045/DUF77 family)
LDGRRSRARRSSITTLGTPAEVTRQEIHIEPFTQRLVAVLVTQEENLPSSALPNETNAMFTNVEGDWDEVMPVIKQCVDHVAGSAPRVSVVIKIDHRPGTAGRLGSKVEAVERRLEGR